MPPPSSAGHRNLVADRIEVDDVLWEAVVAGRLENGETGALVLTGYWTGSHPELNVSTVLTTDDTAAVVVLGVPHPHLAHLGVRWHDAYPDHELAAQLTRSPGPPTPEHIDTRTQDPAAALAGLVEGAVAANCEAERPAWWPGGRPVAEGPVQTEEVQLG